MTTPRLGLVSCLAIAIALPVGRARAEEPVATAGSTVLFREIEFGLESVDSDTDSSRFHEYRALPAGFFVSRFRFAGDGKLRYDVSGKNVLQSDARYHVLVEPWSIRIEADFQKIPHAFGNNAHTLLTDTGPGVLSISDTLQQSFQNATGALFANPTTRAQISFPFLSKLVSPSLAATPSIDLKLLRERGRIAFELTPEKPVKVRLEYVQEHRRGTRAAGTSFGFGDAVESPEPIDYTTRDLFASAEWSRGSGLIHAGLRLNQFKNAIATESFDNPFRATDSTDAAAYTAPGAGSVGGPAFGRVSLPPDNKAVTGSLGGLVKFKKSTRLSADVSYGQWTQNDPFMAATSNSAIAAPPLAASSLDGRIDVLSLTSSFTSRPAPKLFLTARFKHYDFDDKTARIAMPGYVRFDAVFEAIPRISVPYGHTDDNALVSAAYDIGPATLEAGYRYDKRARTFRETESTTQQLGYAKLDVRAKSWAVLRASYENGHRGYGGLEIERSEDASLGSPAAPANILAAPAASVCPAGGVCNLRFDQSEKDVKRYGAHLELQPGGDATVSFSYGRGTDDYTKSLFGLLNATNESFSVDADWTPAGRFNLYAYYGHDKGHTFQRGRQSGATLSLSTLDDWTATIDDKAETWGGGGELDIVKDRLKLKVNGSYQKVNGNNDLFADPAGIVRAKTGATDIPFFDDTKLSSVAAELAYKIPGWLLALGGWYESYSIADANTSGLANYVPGSFFLAPDDGAYKGHVVYARATYSW